MTTAVVSMYGQGQITIPKIWRDKFNTKHFFLSMNDEELIIKPVLEKQKLDPDLKDFYEALGDIKNGNVTSYNNIDEFEKAFI